MELIERVERGVPLPELLAAFNEPSTSDYLVVYLRLLTSGCLQRHRRFFEQPSLARPPRLCRAFHSPAHPPPSPCTSPRPVPRSPKQLHRCAWCPPPPRTPLVHSPSSPRQEVEPMCKESDHIHIIALARALQVPVLVEYMDRGEGGATNPHVFPEGSQPRVCLLYRPGHYDILYK
ncbi:ubiquitin thioesterase OTUB1-like [Meleagris gallopavo]|uniref:ubiquitin thioesterase OTUB1-like n=1 Tax=Meleagris gallopavo TaxID=9103 RepID=UPI000549B904|nr:ubiquitin thioesterase OTUB1-like [Meleagris gallopavo]